MDLGTVTSNLEAGKYEKEEDFYQHVMLTFSNAMKYNPDDNPIHLLALQLKKKFKESWSKARPDSDLNDVLDSRELNGTGASSSRDEYLQEALVPTRRH